MIHRGQRGDQEKREGTGNTDNTYNCLLFIGNAEIYARISCNTRSRECPGSVWRRAESRFRFLASQQKPIKHCKYGPKKASNSATQWHRQVEKIINFWRNVIKPFLRFGHEGQTGQCKLLILFCEDWLEKVSVVSVCPVPGWLFGSLRDVLWSEANLDNFVKMDSC